MDAKLTWKNGSPFYSINGTEYIPVSYRTCLPNTNTLKNFNDKGFELHYIYPSGILSSIKAPYSNCGEVWEGEGSYNWERLRIHVNTILDACPNAKLALIVQLDTRDWYLNQNADAWDSYSHLDFMCRDEKWRQSAARFLKDVIRFMEKEYPERVYAVYLFAGHTCEWYSTYPEDGLVESKQFLKSFREWFGDDQEIPTHEELMNTTFGVFRHPLNDQKALRFWEFYSEIIADTIGYFAGIVKEYTDGKLLVGVFYGYLMSFFHSYLRGHNSFHTVVSNPDVDLIFSPSAYLPFRGMESVNAFNLTVDSIWLHNKVYLHEIDNTTSLTTNNQYANKLQILHQRPANVDDSITYARRDSARVMEHAGGYWWFDMWGGWFDDVKLMDGLAEIQKAAQKIYKVGTKPVSEVAVFTDARSALFLAEEKEGIEKTVVTEYDSEKIHATPIDAKSGIAVQYDTIYEQQNGLNRLGAPVSYFETSDITYFKFPHDQYKLYVFLNLFAPTDEIVATIKQLQAAGKSMLFFYAPGYIGKEDYSLSSMKELTGFDYQITERENIGKIVSCANPQITWGGGKGVKPIFTVDEDTCEVIGRYKQSGLPAAAIIKNKEAINVWVAGGPMPAEELRRIAKRAGVFIWHDGDDPVYINKGMIGMYSFDGGERIITVPKDCHLRNLYDEDKVYITENCQVKLHFKPKEFKMLLRE